MTEVGQDSLYVDMIHHVIDEAAVFIIHNYPALQRATLGTLESIFQTKAIARQLALAIALETGLVAANQANRLLSSLLSNFSAQSCLIRHLEGQQLAVTSQDEWMDLADRIDRIQGDDMWRSDPNCSLYERDRISARIDELVHLMRRRDIFELMFLLRGGIARNKFGLLHEGLFSRALGGSKVLVETYHNVVCAALDFVCDAPVPEGIEPIPTDARLAFFNETRHSYGRTALLLSGGAALGMYHIGVVKTLIKSRLMPRVIGGSSAGSIIAAMLGTRTDEECLNDWFSLKGTNAPGHSGRLGTHFFRFFNLPISPDQPKTIEGGQPDSSQTKRMGLSSWMAKTRFVASVLYNLLTFKVSPGDLLLADSEHLQETLRTNIGEFTFQEAFDRTGRILNITVTPTNSSDPPRLLNYLTAPHVLVWSASLASCALPGVFQSTRLMVKEADGTMRYETSERSAFADGSMEQDLPMQQLSEMFNVNHFIISQSNIHAVLLASYNHFRSVWSNPFSGFLKAVVTFWKRRWQSWLEHFVEFVGTRRFAPIHATSRAAWARVFVQKYEGRHCDISLTPWLNHRGLVSALMAVLSNPEIDEIEEWIVAAERETWKHIPAIKSHIAEEVTLDRCVQRLRSRLVTECRSTRRNTSTSRMMGARVPSFFASPSLVHLGNMDVADQACIERVEFQSQPEGLDSAESMDGATSDPLQFERKSWGAFDGSASSGLFIDDDPATGQAVREGSKRLSATRATTMAHFYYRNSSFQTDLNRAQSHDRLVRKKKSRQNRLSKSHAELPAM